MKIFNEYSNYYDLLYSDKDYPGEVDFVNGILIKHNLSPGKLLSLGSGTGTHDFFFVKKGYEVFGVDSSNSMLNIAKEKYPQLAANFAYGDARDLRLNQTFSAILSLFNVINYMITNDEISKFFSTCTHHLQRDGILIFDTWYGPAVRKIKPSIRTKELENENLKIIRVASPKHYPNLNQVDINYDIEITNKINGAVFFMSEKHRIRYLFLPEIEKSLNSAGFSLLEIIPWMNPDSAVNETNWNVTVVAKKI